jgi:hypothetical protein
MVSIDSPNIARVRNLSSNHISSIECLTVDDQARAARDAVLEKSRCVVVPFNMIATESGCIIKTANTFYKVQ